MRKQALIGKNIALIFEKTLPAPDARFEVAAFSTGAPGDLSRPKRLADRPESMKDTARVLGRMYDGIEYIAVFGQHIVLERAGEYTRAFRLERPDR